MKRFIVGALLMLASAAHALEARDIVASALDSYNAGDYAEALGYFDSVLELRLDGVEQDSELNYKLNYYAGYSARAVGDYTKAAAYFATALALAQELRHEEQYPVLNSFLGEVQKERGEYASALAYYEAALSQLEEDSAEAATLWYLMAECSRGAQDYEASILSSSKALELATAHKLTKLNILCLTSAGEVYNEIGNYSEAIRNFTVALTIARNAQLPLEMANIHLGSALVYEALEKNDLARQNLDEALKLYVLCANNSNINLIVDRLMTLPPSTVAQSLRAIENYEDYTELYSGLNDQESALLMLMLIGHHQNIADETENAATTFSQIVSIAMQFGFNNEAARAAIYLADIYYANDELDKAIAVLSEAQQYQAVQSPPIYLAEIFGKKAELYEKSEDLDAAAENYQKAADSSLAADKREEYAKAVARVLNKL